jgi:glycosyltransferase involved in cell wall biosynthesis
MKINVYCYDDIKNPRCGGGGAYRELTVHKMLSQRHAIFFCTGNFKGATDSSEKNFTYKHLGFKTSYLISRISFSLFATIHSFFSNADIIAIPYSIYSPVLTFLFKPKKTVVLFFHITGKEACKKYGIFGIFPQIAEKLVLATGQNFLTLTDSMAKTIQQKRPKVKAKAGYVSFDTSLLSTDSKDDNFILCFGRIDIHMKGIDILIPAFESIAGKYTNHRLIIAGRGQESDITWLTKRVKESPFFDRIQILTNTSEEQKKKLFHTATFVCMPSRFEGWNIAAIEAAACSKATLGTKIHGLMDAINENETGILVEPENSKALAEKMDVLLRDKSLREALGKKGYIWAQQFTIERVAAIQEDFYKSVARNCL